MSQNNKQTRFESVVEKLTERFGAAKIRVGGYSRKCGAFWGAGVLRYALLFTLILLIIIVFRETGHVDETLIKYITAVMLFIVAGIYALRSEKKIDLAVIIILCGIIIRVGYTLYTPINVRSHDLGALSPDGKGHYAYIYNILTTGKLKNANYGQFYHPPLFYALSALLVKFLEIFFKHDAQFMIEYAKVISCFAGSVTLIVFNKIFKEAGIKKLSLPTAITAFFPNLILMSGRVNNDALSVMFISLCVLYTFRWHKNKTFRNIIILALCFGLGMMSKLSCATMAFFTGAVMLIDLYKAVKKKECAAIIKQLLLFGIICVPLGMWYPIRNLIMFGQGFGYVPAEVFVTPDDKTGDIMIRKFLSFDFWNSVIRQYSARHNSKVEISILQAILRTSMFGEFSFKGKDAAAKLLQTVNIFIVFSSVVAMVYVLVKGKAIKLLSRYGLAVVWAVTFIPYLLLNYKVPFTYTMDFRYLSMTILTGAAYIGIFSELKPKAGKYMNYAVALFCGLVFAMYLT